MEPVKYLKINECKDGYLYKILARNASYGIYRAEKQDFTILRTKFHDTYLFEEIHWDANQHFGTVKPLEEIEKSPFTGEDLEQELVTEEDGRKYWSRRGDIKAIHEYLENLR